ncbi:hypothetical protein BO94DRAFT_309562 [Aspergillus sclerotioniger CBS 115572]|uniref:Uncharacterized protein n=1 Tax=Aspergillus sclerotioniger CBS 115572 TaxID=1450535 RepID=A0A317V4Z8_9EURO|nr:hypothetical protein BO94DRAFT_309562 [Aspergillus sclerotioniger CBS 115572]PWY67270.1 hypothetical protein BO94DRAFT_309562 [Aspergillus sclerotioniger CBS 115572]
MGRGVLSLSELCYASNHHGGRGGGDLIAMVPRLDKRIPPELVYLSAYEYHIRTREGNNGFGEGWILGFSLFFSFLFCVCFVFHPHFSLHRIQSHG